MKRIIIVVIFLFLSLNLSAQKFKMGGDKMLHFTASYTISHITYHYLQPRVGYKKAKIYSMSHQYGHHYKTRKYIKQKTE